MNEWTEQREQEARARIQGASPLPWYSAGDLMSGAVVDAKGADVGYLEACSEENTELAVNAPQDLADALDEISRLRALTTVDDDMVERAAQQLWAEMDTWASAAWCNEWARQPEHTRNAYRSHARAALEAALNPRERA